MALVVSLANLYLWELSLFHQKRDFMGKYRGKLFQDFPGSYLSFSKYCPGKKGVQMVKV